MSSPRSQTPAEGVALQLPVHHDSTEHIDKNQQHDDVDLAKVDVVVDDDDVFGEVDSSHDHAFGRLMPGVQTLMGTSAEKLRVAFLVLLPTAFIWMTPWLASLTNEYGRHFQWYAIEPRASIQYNIPELDGRNLSPDWFRARAIADLIDTKIFGSSGAARPQLTEEEIRSHFEPVDWLSPDLIEAKDTVSMKRIVENMGSPDSSVYSVRPRSEENYDLTQDRLASRDRVMLVACCVALEHAGIFDYGRVEGWNPHGFHNQKGAVIYPSVWQDAPSWEGPGILRGNRVTCFAWF